MERLDDGVFRALLDRAIGPERAAKAYPAFFTAPTTAIRLNPFKPASAGTPPEEHFPQVTCDEEGVPAGAVSEGTGPEEHFPQVSCDEEPTPSDTRIPWSKWGRILKERPVFTLDPLYHAGAYYVQDSSAQFVGHVFRKALAAEADSAQPAALFPIVHFLQQVRYNLQLIYLFLDLMIQFLFSNYHYLYPLNHIFLLKVIFL